MFEPKNAANTLESALYWLFYNDPENEYAMGIILRALSQVLMEMPLHQINQLTLEAPISHFPSLWEGII
jgi:hypothetical protein